MQYRSSSSPSRRPSLPLRRLALTACLGLALTGTAQAESWFPFGTSQDPLLACQTLAAVNAITLASADALVGKPAFGELRQGQDMLGRLTTALEPHPQWRSLAPLVRRMQHQAGLVAAQEPLLRSIEGARRTLRGQTADVLESAEGVNAVLIKEGAQPPQLVAGGMLSMLLQRIASSSSEFLTVEGLSPESVFLLGKDSNAFTELLQGLREGSPELRLPKPKSAALQTQLSQLAERYEPLRASTGVLLSNLQGLVSVIEARAALSADNAKVSTALYSACMASGTASRR